MGKTHSVRTWYNHPACNIHRTIQLMLVLYRMSVGRAFLHCCEILARRGEHTARSSLATARVSHRHFLLQAEQPHTPALGTVPSVASQEKQVRKLQSNTIIITTTRNKSFGVEESRGIRLLVQLQLRWEIPLESCNYKNTHKRLLNCPQAH